MATAWVAMVLETLPDLPSVSLLLRRGSGLKQCGFASNQHLSCAGLAVICFQYAKIAGFSPSSEGEWIETGLPFDRSLGDAGWSPASGSIYPE